jgi:hypothetical protein
LVADHLSRITDIEQEKVPIAETLPGENLLQVLAVKGKTPWYADYVNYLVCEKLHGEFTY